LIIKRGITDRISNNAIYEIYSMALKAGAIGGKLLRVGGGGFMFFMLKKVKHQY
jgi:D-glycero-alpha-D-manno-heptose-7-phosphate kinase